MKTRKYTINDIEYNVAVNSLSGDSAEVTVNGVTYQVKIGSSDGDSPSTSAVIHSVTAAPVMEEKSAASTPTVVAQIGEPEKEGGCFDLVSTAEAGVYEAVIRRGNSNFSSDNLNFVYYPNQLQPLVENSTKGFELKQDNAATTGVIASVRDNDSYHIQLPDDDEYRLILDFVNNTWRVEKIEQD